MTVPDEISPLLEPIAAIHKLLEQFGGRGVIIGGVALGFLGRPRMTVDVDVMILASTEDIVHLLQTAKELGIEPRIADAETFARKNRVLLLRHTASHINIDISLGMLPFEEEMVERKVVFHVGNLAIPLPTPEDMIILKAVAHRPKDMLDIQEIISSHPELDTARIEQWVRAFSEALEMSAIWDDLEKLLKKSDCSGTKTVGLPKA